MASFCRSAALSAVRSLPSRSKFSLPKPLPSRRPTTTNLVPRSIVAAAECVDSLMPLHSAVASARLKSCIGLDSSCWSFISQGRTSTS